MTTRPHDPTGDPFDPMARRGRRCAAASRTTGRQCRQLAVNGSTVCHFHGGAAPQVRAAAERRNAEAEAARIAARFDLADAPPLTDPVGQLARVAGQTVYMLDRIAEVASGSAPNADDPAFTALERALDRANRLLVEVNKLGLAERQVAISEAQAGVFVKVVTGMVADLGHDLDDPVVKATVAAWLRRGEAIEAGAT